MGTDALRTGAEPVKPRLRGWLHAAAAPVALAATAVLVASARTAAARLSVLVYGLTSVVLFTTSAVYHRGSWTPRTQILLKRWDHANIFLIIAGSYTPFAVLALHGDARVGVLCVVWAGALAGVVFRVLWPGAPRWLYTPLYVLVGWVAVFVLPQLLHGGGPAVLVLLLVGGTLYSAGAVVYGLRRPNPSPRWFGFHEIFHSLTLAAYTVQYVAVSLLVYRTA